MSNREARLAAALEEWRRWLKRNNLALAEARERVPELSPPPPYETFDALDDGEPEFDALDDGEPEPPA